MKAIEDKVAGNESPLQSLVDIIEVLLKPLQKVHKAALKLKLLLRLA